MSYLIKYTGIGTEGQLEPQSPPVYWKTNETRWVEDECIPFYLLNSSVFTVVKDPAAVSDLVSGKIVNITHTATANELLSGHIDFPLAFIPESWTVQAFTSTGAPVYFTDLVTWEASPVNMIRITTDGLTSIAATDEIHLVVIG